MNSTHSRLNRKLQQLFDVLEHEREALLTTIRLHPHDRLEHQPGAGRWSVRQVLTHLVISERLSLTYLQKKSLGIQSVGNSGIVESIKSFLLTLSQRLPLKYKAPKYLKESTPEQWPIAKIEEEWRAVRNDMRTFLATIGSHQLKKKIYKHPVAGRLDVRQAMKFIRDHIDHHRPQIIRLLK